jgi:hypothetical protein
MHSGSSGVFFLRCLCWKPTNRDEVQSFVRLSYKYV